MKTLVLGIGNTLLADEGVGVVAMRALQEMMGAEPTIDFIDGGTLSFTLAAPIAECEALIVFDAAMVGGPAGSVASFEGAAMDVFLGENRKASVHEVGLIDLMVVSQLTERWPARRALIGIQPARVDWGEELSPAVAAGVAAMCDIAAHLIAVWRVDQLLDSSQ